MRIVNLVENTEGAAGCAPAHGLSFYIETKRHRLLMDTGPSALLIENAQRLGVDLSGVDTVILSHGHYDHADGIPPFARLDPSAPVYLRRGAEGDFWSLAGESPRYIGVDPAVLAHPQLRWVEGERELDEELLLFGEVTGRRFWPQSNRVLRRRENGEFLQDEFAHEQCLIVRENGKRVLLSGCAHNGILNILDRFAQVCGGVPDAVISGFHMMKKTAYTPEEEETIRATARELREKPCTFYTCHCTGLAAFELMRGIMGERLQYVHCGDTIEF